MAYNALVDTMTDDAMADDLALSISNTRSTRAHAPKQ